MPTLSAIQNRLEKLANTQNCLITQQIIEQLKRQNYKGQLSSDLIQQWCQQFHLSSIQLALHCVSIAACYALPQISNFYVGSVAIGSTGHFYFGANQEFTSVAIQQTIHAEQSAIAHAWHAGENGITDIAVSATPCGHCRQFMNELNNADILKIHLPHSQYNLLQRYLPDSFGPKNLNVKYALFDLQLKPSQNEDIIQSAILAAQYSHAPYTKANSGVALQLGKHIISGRYAENAAFNPSLLPLQSALNQRRLLGLADIPISRIIMSENKAGISHRAITENLAKYFLAIDKIEYISL